MRAFPMFRQSPPKMIQSLLDAVKLAKFSSNTLLYLEGDGCRAIGFLLSGEIRVYKVGEQGREITLYGILPGEICILNAACILSGRSYPACAAAVEDGEMLMLPETVFLRLIAEYEDMRKFVFRLFSDRFAVIVELIDEVVFARMDTRIKDYLLEKSENGLLPVTHQKIADDLGSSREVVSRLLKDLEKKGRVRLYRNLIEILSLAEDPE